MFFNLRSNFTRDRRLPLAGPAAFFLLLLSLTATAYSQKTSEINSGLYGNEQIEGRIFFPPGDKGGVRPIVKLLTGYLRGRGFAAPRTNRPKL